MSDEAPDKPEEIIIPRGDLQELADDYTPSIVIGIMSVVWTLWTIASMFIPWQNSANSGSYDAPIWYIFSQQGEFAIFGSWLPTGYLAAWIFNFILYLTELVAWLIGGAFYVFWAKICLFGGVILPLIPVVFESTYIWYEYPLRQSGKPWDYIFWTAEFFLLFMQLLFWFISFAIHALFVGPLEDQRLAKIALSKGITTDCICDACLLPEDELERQQAEQTCKIACNKKCPAEVPNSCPLEQFAEESLEDYARRCMYAAKLAQEATAKEEEIKLPQEEEEDLIETVDDIASPEDEW